MAETHIAAAIGNGAAAVLGEAPLPEMSNPLVPMLLLRVCAAD